MKPTRSDNEMVKHHVLPRSRGGTSSPENIIRVRRIKHKAFHLLFSNKTPEEVIEYLVYYFWGNDWSWVDKAKKRYGR